MPVARSRFAQFLLAALVGLALPAAARAADFASQSGELRSHHIRIQWLIRVRSKDRREMGWLDLADTNVCIRNG